MCFQWLDSSWFVLYTKDKKDGCTCMDYLRLEGRFASQCPEIEEVGTVVLSHAF